MKEVVVVNASDSANYEDKYLDLIDILAILYLNRRCAVLGGIVGFLIAVISVALMPNRWETILTLSPPDEISVLPFWKCSGIGGSDAQINSASISNGFFENFVNGLSDTIKNHAEDGQKLSLVHNRNGYVEIKIESRVLRTNQAQEAIQLLDVEKNKVNKLISNKFADCHISQLPEPYHRDSNIVVKLKGVKYSVRLILGFVFGIIISGLLVLIRAMAVNVKHELDIKLEGMKNEKKI